MAAYTNSTRLPPSPLPLLPLSLTLYLSISLSLSRSPLPPSGYTLASKFRKVPIHAQTAASQLFPAAKKVVEEPGPGKGRAKLKPLRSVEATQRSLYPLIEEYTSNQNRIYLHWVSSEAEASSVAPGFQLRTEEGPGLWSRSFEPLDILSPAILQ